MKVTMSIGGIATSAARMRALALVSEAIAKREAGIAAERPPQKQSSDANRYQQTRGK
jgi:hypothetical protein